MNSADGAQWIKDEYKRVFNREPVGNCSSCLLDMYNFLSNYEKPKINMADYKFTVKKDYQFVQVAGSIKDLSKFSQKEIKEFLKENEGHEIFFDKEEIKTEKK